MIVGRAFVQCSDEANSTVLLVETHNVCQRYHMRHTQICPRVLLVLEDLWQYLQQARGHCQL